MVKKKVKKSVKPKKKNVSSLKKKADKVFSEYIRKRDKYKCFTCGSTTGRMQCGHFISRRYLKYRYHETNNHCQCVRCNIFLKGNMILYTLKMIDIYKRETIDFMLKTQSDISEYSVEEYEKIISEFQEKEKCL